MKPGRGGTMSPAKFCAKKLRRRLQPGILSSHSGTYCVTFAKSYICRMNIILFDDSRRDHLLPLTFTRPQGALRIGILTIAEKWEKLSGGRVSFLTSHYLSELFPLQASNDNFLVTGSIIPDSPIFEAIQNLNPGEALTSGSELIAARCNEELSLNVSSYKTRNIELPDTNRILNVWDLFTKNASALEADFELLTSGRKSADIPEGNRILGKRIFLEEGATISCSIINTNEGPVYLGKNAEIWEGSIVRGPFALCEGASVKMGAKIYGATTVGPHSRVGGEITNSVIIGYSNKGHDGFLGNSVIGEWCNLGADTNNSNLKNNYAEVKLWNYPSHAYKGTGLQFCGLIMGDHSKCGINTMFNTGTVVGVYANIYGAGFPPTYIPSFSWGGAGGFVTHKPEKAAETAERVYHRRHKEFGSAERAVLQELYRQTELNPA